MKAWVCSSWPDVEPSRETGFVGAILDPGVTENTQGLGSRLVLECAQILGSWELSWSLVPWEMACTRVHWEPGLWELPGNQVSQKLSGAAEAIRHLGGSKV